MTERYTKNRLGHYWMSNAGGAVTILYPDPDAAYTAAGGGTTGTATSSPFDPSNGTREAIIHAIYFGTATGGSMDLQTHTGQHILTIDPSMSNGPAPGIQFGPQGIRVPEGFRMDVTATGGEFLVVYEIV